MDWLRLNLGSKALLEQGQAYMSSMLCPLASQSHSNFCTANGADIGSLQWQTYPVRYT